MLFLLFIAFTIVDSSFWDSWFGGEEDESNYELIINCGDFENLAKEGWFVNFTSCLKEDEGRYLEKRKSKVISFLGENKRGKTFLLNHLVSENFKSSGWHHTKGISIASKERLGYLIDTEGFFLFNQKGSEMAQKQFQRMLTKFLVSISGIVIIVTGEMNWNEQKLVDDVKKYASKIEKYPPQIFLVHNFQNVDIEAGIRNQIEDQIVDPKYFGAVKEKFLADPNNRKTIDLYKSTGIGYHFTLGNQNTMKYYNDLTFRALRLLIQNSYDKKFNIINDLMKFSKNFCSEHVRYKDLELFYDAKYTSINATQNSEAGYILCSLGKNTITPRHNVFFGKDILKIQVEMPGVTDFFCQVEKQLDDVKESVITISGKSSAESLLDEDSEAYFRRKKEIDGNPMKEVNYFLEVPIDDINLVANPSGQMNLDCTCRSKKVSGLFEISFYSNTACIALRKGMIKKIHEKKLEEERRLEEEKKERRSGKEKKKPEGNKNEQNSKKKQNPMYQLAMVLVKIENQTTDGGILIQQRDGRKIGITLSTKILLGFATIFVLLILAVEIRMEKY